MTADHSSISAAGLPWTDCLEKSELQERAREASSMRARGGGGGGRAGGGKLHERVEQIVSQLQIPDTDSLPGAITEARTRLGLSPGGGRALIELVAEIEQEIQRHPLPDLYDERAEPERWHATEVMRSDSDDDDDDDDDFQSADEDERECGDGRRDKVAECDRLVEEEHAFLDCAKAYDWAGVERTLGTQPELVNVQPSGRWSALHQAASADDAQAVAMLLHFHADPRLRDADSRTAREVAGSAEVARLLEQAEQASATAMDNAEKLRQVMETIGAVGGTAIRLPGACNWEIKRAVDLYALAPSHDSPVPAADPTLPCAGTSDRKMWR